LDQKKNTQVFKGFGFWMQERKCSNRRHADELHTKQNFLSSAAV